MNLWLSEMQGTNIKHNNNDSNKINVLCFIQNNNKNQISRMVIQSGLFLVMYNLTEKLRTLFSSLQRRIFIIQYKINKLNE